MTDDMSRESSDFDDFYEESTSDGSGFCTEQINGALKLGAKYSTFVQLQRTVQAYCQENSIRLFRSDSRKLKSARIRVNPQVIKKAPECLVYYSLTYSCVYGGKSFKNRNSSNKDGCKFIVRIGLTKDCHLLEVVRMSDSNVHNHTRSELPSTSTPKKATLTSPIPIVKSQKQPIVNPEPDSTNVNIPQICYTKHMTSKLMEYRKSGLFCDTAIIASDGTLYAHSAILAMFCPNLFWSLNQRPLQTHQPNVIDLAKYSSKVIDGLLDFFYIGKVGMEHFEELQELSRHLGIAFNIQKMETDKDGTTVNNQSNPLDASENARGHDEQYSTRTSSEYGDQNGDASDDDEADQNSNITHGILGHNENQTSSQPSIKEEPESSNPLLGREYIRVLNETFWTSSNDGKILQCP